jgi:hypothetical protein
MSDYQFILIVFGFFIVAIFFLYNFYQITKFKRRVKKAFYTNEVGIDADIIAENNQTKNNESIQQNSYVDIRNLNLLKNNFYDSIETKKSETIEFMQIDKPQYYLEKICINFGIYFKDGLEFKSVKNSISSVISSIGSNVHILCFSENKWLEFNKVGSMINAIYFYVSIIEENEYVDERKTVNFKNQIKSSLHYFDFKIQESENEYNKKLKFISDLKVLAENLIDFILVPQSSHDFSGAKIKIFLESNNFLYNNNENYYFLEDINKNKYLTIKFPKIDSSVNDLSKFRPESVLITFDFVQCTFAIEAVSEIKKLLGDFTSYLNAILKFSNNKEFDLKEFEIIEEYILNVYEKLDSLEIAPGSPVISGILNKK